MVSTNFLVDDDVVVVATESDAAASWIADDSMVQQLGKPFASMDNISPFVDFDGQLISLTPSWEEIGAQLSMRR